MTSHTFRAFLPAKASQQHREFWLLNSMQITKETNKKHSRNDFGNGDGRCKRKTFLENYCWLLVKEITNYHGHNNYENAKEKNLLKFFYNRGHLESEKKTVTRYSQKFIRVCFYFFYQRLFLLMFLTALNHIKITTLTNIYCFFSGFASLQFTFHIFHHLSS